MIGRGWSRRARCRLGHDRTQRSHALAGIPRHHQCALDRDPRPLEADCPLAQFENTFINHDCSTVGFEGIRAQDILPLLLDRFQFHRFAAWGGLLDIFVDRAFGHNLSSEKPFDREFIDTMWETNRP